MHPQLKILVDAETLAKVNPNPGGAVVVTDRYAAQNAKTIEAMVAAVIEANRALYNDRAFFDARRRQVVSRTSTTPSRRSLLYDAYRPVVGRQRRSAARR